MSTRALLWLIALAAAAVGAAWWWSNRKRTGPQQVATAPVPATSLLPTTNTLPAGTVVSPSYASSHLGSYAKNTDGTLVVQTTFQSMCGGFAAKGCANGGNTPKPPSITNPAPAVAAAPSTPQGGVTIKPRAVGSTPPAAGTACNKGGIGGIGAGKINASGACV